MYEPSRYELEVLAKHWADQYYFPETDKIIEDESLRKTACTRLKALSAVIPPDALNDLFEAAEREYLDVCSESNTMPDDLLPSVDVAVLIFG